MLGASSAADPSSLSFAAISTHASVLRDNNRLVRRYGDAILDYATRLLHSREEAEDIHMDVLQSMLDRDKFFRTPCAPGRFRFYVKRAVHNAVANYKRRRAREQGRMKRVFNAVCVWRWGKGPDNPAAPPADAALEQDEMHIWRKAILDRTLEALEAYEREHQDRTRPSVYHTLARLLIVHPGDTSDEIARRLSAQVDREYNANNTRALVLRLRMKFVELLLVEISQQLDDPGYDNVLDELRDLDLFAYVQPYLPLREVPTTGV